MVIQRDINVSLGGILPHGPVRDANGLQIFAGDFRQLRRTDVVPFPMRIDFVADDVSEDVTVRTLRRAKSIRQEFETRLEIPPAFGVNDVKTSDPVRRFLAPAGRTMRLTRGSSDTVFNRIKYTRTPASLSGLTGIPSTAFR